ncbi:class I SAM-dependent methyltransferase [Romboutsia sp. 1001285H_161024_C4]|uniref:class I SAM-dependent methyltransferase n=1 Tax=Romboutsia sp. 1001285H_161024_C4 TaxID=2787109 RepID=UPI00189C47BD|nr:class I SAM-dependent methyltransferase [Romboutsia sp. 1001285H_161024_C4]
MNENKFNGMGKIYSKYRPSYPFDFIDYFFTDVGISQRSIIADIGSGTGILTRQLLEKGSKVYGIEPNADMRDIAETNLNNFLGFTSVNGNAENTTIDDNSVDYITVAQAFHWFDRERFKKECQRILKPEEKVILVWNIRDNNNELVIENYEVNRKYCPNFKGFSDGMYGKTNKDDFSDFFNGKYETKVFPNNLIFDMDEFIGRNLSSSYALKSNDSQYNNYVNELKKIYKKYSNNGQLIMPNLTRSYVGDV